MTQPRDPSGIKFTDKRGQSKVPPGAEAGSPGGVRGGDVVPPPSDGPDATDGATEMAKLAEERLDQLLRMKADFENFRKRSIREQTDLIERASLRIIEQLLPVIDNLTLALNHARESGSDAIADGIELVAKQLHDVLESEGLERVITEGAFDPHEHEAVASIPGDVTEPTVLEVVRPGYKLKGKTVRPALVHVSVPSEEGG